MSKLSNILAVISCMSIFLLSACGFHLRSTNTAMPATYKKIAIMNVNNAINTNIIRIFQQILRQNNVLFVDMNADPDATLILSNYQLNRRDLASGVHGQEREYTLNMLMDIELKDRAGNIIFENAQFSSQRDLRYNESKVLGKSEGELLVEQDMSLSILNSFLRQLKAKVNVQ